MLRAGWSSPESSVHRSRVRELVGAAVFAALALATSEARAEPAHIFRLPAARLDTALVRFALQAQVSIGGLPTAGCGPISRPVLGLLTPEAALKRLLPAGCGFERVDARAFRIVSRPGAPPHPPAVSPVPSVAADISELIVTAERRREPLRGSPFAVSALSGQEVTRLGARSFADITAQLPGVAETNLGPGRDKIFIRGLSDGAFTGRAQSTVGLYLDDVPITYNAPDPDLRLADIARVEVLRGPQGSLYGSGSIGGIVRFVTNAPDPLAFAAHAAGEARVGQTGEVSYGAEAMLNLPGPDGRAALRGVIYRDVDGGYLDNPRLGLKDVNDGYRTGGRLSGLVRLGDAWTAEATFAIQSIATHDAQYVQVGRTARTSPIREPHDNDFTLFGGTIRHAGSAVDVRLSAAVIDHDITTRYNATGTFDLAPRQLAGFDDAQHVELAVAEGVVTSRAQGPWRWLVGGFASRSDENSSGVLDATLSGGQARSAYRRRDRLTEAALFGEASYELTDRLTVAGGGRLFATRVVSQADDFELATAALPAMRRRLTDSGFAPKLRLSYALAPSTVLYAQAQDGYRAGGFNVPAAADGVPGGPDAPSFRPDRLHSYEIGGETSLFEDVLTLRAALFKAVWRDVQTDQFRASGLPLTVNIGDGKSSGVEFEAVWRPDTHWRLRIDGLLNEPELTRSGDVFPARADIGLPGVAKVTGGVDVSYRWRVAEGVTAEVAGQASYVGRSMVTFDGDAASAMGGYGQGRIHVGLSSRLWEAQAFVSNVTNEAGDTFAYGNPFSRGRARQSTPLPPRAFGLAIGRSF
jgi:iron complex outermembrane receptor protein